MCQGLNRSQTHKKMPSVKNKYAKVAELADAPDLGSGSGKGMGVQISPFAPSDNLKVTGEKSAFSTFFYRKEKIMQVNVEDVSAVKKILHIEIPEEQVSREVAEAYKNLKKTVKVKGFRPGKTPRSVLEGLYGKNVSAEVSGKLIQESFEDAVKETGLSFLGPPAVSSPELKEKEPFRYSAEIEILPVIGDVDITGLKLKKRLYRVTDSDVEQQIEMLRKNMGHKVPIREDRPAERGDSVLVDFEGFKDGKPFAEIQKTENYAVKIGDGQVLKELDDALSGMKAGETREVSVRFPESHPNENLANIEAGFRITLNEIREDLLPDVNDEFAKRFGKYQTLDDLKKDITENLGQGYEKRIEQELQEQIFEALSARKDFDIPDVMVEYELKGIMEDAERTFSYHNTSMEQLGITEESFSEKYRGTAVKQVRRHLLLGRVIEQEKLSLSDEELETEFETMSLMSGRPVEEVKGYYKENNEKLEYFKHALLEKKAMRLIIEHSIIEEVEPEIPDGPEKTEFSV